MKRWLNLNDFGARFLLVIAIFIVGIPGILFLLKILLGTSGTAGNTIDDLIKVSVVLGIGMTVIFCGLTILEQVLDRRIFKDYLKNRGEKLAYAEDKYECQYCGCRSVKKFDKVCPACGRSFTA